MSTHAQSRWFALPAIAAFETGDSFSDQGGSYRLYGVQACLRGTRFTNAYGQSRDCGEASLAMLIALTRDLHPVCTMIARTSDGKTFVTCVAQPTTGAAAGSRIDLGTALIASGYAFAAQGADGHPVHAPYHVAQELAQQKRLGLWAFPDLPDPNAILASTLSKARSGTARSGIRP